MKRFFTLSLLICSFVSLKAQDVVKSTDVLSLKQTEYNFGKIPQGKPVFHYFEVVNTGDKPLKIDNIQAACGCTTPEWSKEPIPAGGSTKIKVGYNSAAEGPFDKSITVIYNGDQSKQIRIKGDVWKAPVGSAPANAAIQFLKQQTL
jgi:hypothetical protein